MNPPTPHSVACRILSCALQGVAGDLGRIRWAFHGSMDAETIALLESWTAAISDVARLSENEALRLEYQATLPAEEAAKETKP